MTPLHVASSQGSLTVAKCLINAGANLRSLDQEQMTPLHFACMEGSLEVAKLLFETGEHKPQPSLKESNLNVIWSFI